MLTKDLVRFKRAKEKVHPQFIDPTKSELRSLSDALVTLFQTAPGRTRGELSEAIADLASGSRCSDLVVRGLEKLLFDRTDFESPNDDALSDWRHQLFIQVNQWFQSSESPTYPHFKKDLATLQQEPFESLQTKLFSDLPDYLPATRFRELSGLQLLHRYNCAQVQWLLLQTAKLNIILPHKDTSHLRQLCKYLRFHQLLAEVSRTPTGTFHIAIDGPMSMFHQSQKYGLSLARFFPALLHQPVWRLEAEVRLNKRTRHILELDHQSKLKPYSHQFHAYTPREIQMFEDAFRSKVAEWDISAGIGFIPLEGEHLCFPDFHIRHSGGTSVDLEFFHPWHAAPLHSRLKQLSKAKNVPLLLGVSRKLIKDVPLKNLLENSQHFQSYGFLFSEIPAVRPVEKILRNLEPSLPI